MTYKRDIFKNISHVLTQNLTFGPNVFISNVEKVKLRTCVHKMNYKSMRCSDM